MNLDPTCEQERNIELNFKRIFTDRNEVGAKVMFLLMSVILFTGGLPQCMLGYPPGGRPPSWEQAPPGAGTPPREADLPPGIQSMSGRYASYWNAFLCVYVFASTGKNKFKTKCIAYTSISCSEIKEISLKIAFICLCILPNIYMSHFSYACKTE